jgi:hypothetical protein
VTATARLTAEGELPDLGGTTAWLNPTPLTAEGLRGSIVAVQFCTSSCINWLRTVPYVKAWAAKHRDDGRLHQLVGQHGLIVDRTFAITLLDAGAQAHVFTFG